MGSVHFSLRSFYDSSSEFVGIKSGILLNRFQIQKILLAGNYDENYLHSDNLDQSVRVHSSTMEEMLTTIRKQIGNLPMVSPTEKDYQYMREYRERTGDLDIILMSSSIGFRYVYKNPKLTASELASLIHKNEGVEPKLSLAIANISLEKHDVAIALPAQSEDSIDLTNLTDLFDTEIESDTPYMEQKFIDYLAINGHEIELIHWRNFERFCAEYFQRQGYKVVLGPGSNDGGVDIRVYKENGTTPEIMIQCKRYKKENKVSIESVKAFYTDVHFENAKNGLIATSSYIAPGGKKVSSARGYNLSFAENENVKNWAKEIWTFRKQ